MYLVRQKRRKGGCLKFIKLFAKIDNIYSSNIWDI